jgi:AraC family transcriptional regulator, arabinose operon regulatory protein
LITYTLAGEGRYCLAGQTHFCCAGDIFILAPGTVHDYATAHPTQRWEFYWAHFTPRAHWLPWLRLPEPAPGLFIQKIEQRELKQRLDQAFIRLLRDSQGIGAWQAELAANALEEVILLLAQYQEKQNAPQLDERVETILAYLNQRFREPINIANLAALVALSPSRLAHLFKKQVGASIMETVLHVRLRQAARLLEFTALSAGEIAHEVGFQSGFYFSRQFKTYYGRSPTEYRRQAQKAG